MREKEIDLSSHKEDVVKDTQMLLDKYTNELMKGIESPSLSKPLIKTEKIDERIKAHNLEVSVAISEQKISLREKLTKTVQKIIWVQIIFFNIIVLFIVAAVILNIPIFKKIDNDLAKLLFDFLKYYIGATIVELFGMLVFVLHYAFSDTSKFKDKIKEIKELFV